MPSWLIFDVGQSVRNQFPVLSAGFLAFAACVNHGTEVIPFADPGAEFPSAQVQAFRGNFTLSNLVGSYRFSNGFWKSELHLARSGRFAVIEISDELDISATETRLRTYPRVEGDWSVMGDGTIAFDAAGNRMLYVPVIVAGNLGLMEATKGTQRRRAFIRTKKPFTKGP